MRSALLLLAFPLLVSFSPVTQTDPIDCGGDLTITAKPKADAVVAKKVRVSKIDPEGSVDGVMKAVERPRAKRTPQWFQGDRSRYWGTHPQDPHPSNDRGETRHSQGEGGGRAPGADRVTSPPG